MNSFIKLHNNIVKYNLSKYLLFYDIIKLKSLFNINLEYSFNNIKLTSINSNDIAIIKHKSVNEQGKKYTSYCQIKVNDKYTEEYYYYWNKKINSINIENKNSHIYMTYSKKGKLQMEKIEITSPKFIRTHRGYFGNGNLQYEHTYTGDDEKMGMQKGYFPNGQLMYEGFYSGIYKYGNHKGYWKNGILAYEYNFDNDGKKYGLQRRWNNDGKLYYEATFDKNICKTQLLNNENKPKSKQSIRRIR